MQQPFCIPCGKAFSNLAGLRGHQQWLHSSSKEQLQQLGRLDEGKETTMPDTCTACVAKDSHIAEVTKSRDETKAEIEKAQKGHPSLREQLEHAETGNCPSCKQAAKDYREKTIAKAFEDITPKAAAALAVKRGGVPREFYIAG